MPLDFGRRFLDCSGRGMPAGLTSMVSAVIITPVRPPRNLREKPRRIFLGAVLFISAVALLAYGLDFAIFRIRVATNRSPYGSVVVNHYTAIAQKNGKTQLIFDPPQPQPCVNAIFPHAGALPCWYLSRHPDQRTDI
jgi:hypothetical protein